MSDFATANRRKVSSPKKGPKAPVLLNEGPETVGMMSVVIGNGGSLDTAVRDVAENGPPRSAEICRRVAELADTRVEADMKKSLLEEVSTLPDSVSAFAMAIHLVVSASEARDKTERDANLKDASETALTGLREAGRTFSSSLNAPCMGVFGIGIMMPMVLMSIIPMMGISGAFGGSAVDMVPLSLVTLVIIPAIVAAIMLTIKARNPFNYVGPAKWDAKQVLPFLAAVPVTFLLLHAGVDAAPSFCIGCVVGGIAASAAIAPGYAAERRRERSEKLIRDSVFGMGNRLISGENFEDSLIGSLRVRTECVPVAESLENALAVCRGDVEGAIREVVGKISPGMSETLCSIYRAGLKDLRDSGRLALSVGRQLKDRESVRRSIRSDLKSMTDTMFATAGLFAPLVLGLCTSMLVPLSDIAGAADFGGVSEVLAIYLAELCAMISVLISFLEGSSGSGSVVRRMGILLPVSMAVFLLSTMIQI